VLAVKRVEFFSDRMSYIFLSVLNVLVLSEEKSGDSKHSFFFKN
jgi:hypothetical protein